MHSSSLPESNDGRRGFISRCLSGVALFGALPISIPRLRGRPPIARMAKLRGTQFSVGWVPTGYRHFFTYTDRPDGFGGGASELGILFRNELPHHQGALFIYICEATAVSQEFGTTAKHRPTLVTLSRSDGRTFQAQYYAGCIWRMNDSWGWSTTEMHSLTAELESYVVGIRGHFNGVSAGDLERVMTSIAVA